MMKRQTLLLLSMMMFSVSAMAAGSLKVGFVNMNQLMNKAPQVKDINQKMQAQFGEPKKQMEEMAESIRKQEKEIKQNELLMTESKLKKSRQDLLANVQKFRVQEAQLGKQMQQVQNQELAVFRGIIRTVLDDIAKQDKYNLILNDGVMYADKSMDITGKVLELLKKAHKK